MTAANFAPALQWVREDEGGNDDDPNDHGGRTSRGITQREYDTWRHAHRRVVKDVWHADDSEIDTIYHDNYWEPWCDKLPSGVDYMFFDMAVNGGPKRAIVLLQLALGVSADGIIGPKTLAALDAAVKTAPDDLINAYTRRKRSFYEAISYHPGQSKFLRGWLKRTDRVWIHARKLVSAH